MEVDTDVSGSHDSAMSGGVSGKTMSSGQDSVTVLGYGACPMVDNNWRYGGACWPPSSESKKSLP